MAQEETTPTAEWFLLVDVRTSALMLLTSRSATLVPFPLLTMSKP